jgi:hypothetical protein
MQDDMVDAAEYLILADIFDSWLESLFNLNKDLSFEGLIQFVVIQMYVSRLGLSF